MRFIQPCAVLGLLCAISQDVTAQTSVMTYSVSGIQFWDNLVTRTLYLNPTHNLNESGDFPANMGAKFQMLAGESGSEEKSKWTQFEHQAQLGLSGSWGTIAIGRQSDLTAGDMNLSNAINRTVSDSSIGVKLPKSNHVVTASYVNQNDHMRSESNPDVKQYSLSFIYALSRTTNLYVARTRLDGINGQAPSGNFISFSSKQIQLGLHHVF